MSRIDRPLPLALSAPLVLAALMAWMGFTACAWAQTADPISFEPQGTWTGTLRCAENSVLCDDENIIIRVVKDARPQLYDVDINAVDNGQESPENHLVMLYDETKHVLTARFNDERRRLNFYALAVKGDHMAGVALINDSFIERSYELKRASMTVTPPPVAPAPQTPPVIPNSGAATSSSAAASSQ